MTDPVKMAARLEVLERVRKETVKVVKDCPRWSGKCVPDVNDCGNYWLCKALAECGEG